MKTIYTRIESRIKTLRGNEYFDNLPENMLKEISEHIHLREYQREIFRPSPQGRQYIVRILQEGDLQ